MTQHLYLSLISEHLPKLFFHQVEQTGGQFNDILVVNREWIFRFPRYRDGVNQLIAEAQLLDALQGKLPLAVPRMIIRNFEPPVPGLAFSGYRRILGEAIKSENIQMLTNAGRDSLARQLAGFLLALHRIPVTDLPQYLPGAQRGEGEMNSLVCDLRQQWEAFYTDVRQKLFPAIREDARKSVTQHFEAYLDDPALQAFIPCLRHGDFGGDNLLWDPAWGQACGVIDFSFCAIGDPAIDLASVSTLGEDFFNRLAARYEPDVQKLEPMLARAQFYRGTFALMEALDGLRDGDEAAYQRGMESYC
jgi:aminoglycoside 2''-phosphotransferase